MTLDPPAPAALRRLDDDVWSQLVGHARRVLRELDADTEPGWDELRGRSTAQLLSGRGRAELEAELATGGKLWAAVADRLSTEDQVAWTQRLATPEGAPQREPGDDDAGAEELARRRKRRSRELQEERDQARRQLAGAEARAQGAEEEAARLRTELTTARRRVAELEQELLDAEQERGEALARLRRQLEHEAEQMRDELRSLRRAEQERRTQEQVRERSRDAADREAEQAAGSRGEGGAGAASDHRVRPGRPTRLPDGVQPDTSAAARALLTAQHLVLVDGYNLTKRHRGHLDLEQQRVALVATLEAAAARFRSEFEVLFDSRHGSPPGTGRRRSVRVSFTAPGVTADDEIVFAVAAAPPDRPILVVTDDRELRERVRPYAVDLLHTGEFLRAVE